MALLHFLARDLLKLGQYTAAAFAIILSALAFSLYHDVWSGGSGPGGFRLGDAIFYFAAGVYFAWIYLQRGFGIVVLAHAIYDLIVLIPLSR
ncbi:MAG: CPBP family glutamic-type intramembrane protease [Planctomycetaceae bacterium]|nr:CPBP family glutamic-type intramembrane protease [Planctomycetaceae bacterium]